jgi:putative SOS response-associated peptidase YedK
MCNDYERQIEWAHYRAALEAAGLPIASSASAAQLAPAADTRVKDIAPIIRAAGNGVELAPLRWGFPAARPGAPPVFNFRSDKRKFDKSKRCLIPASAFFEFTGAGSPKNKWRFELAGSRVLAIAGLWREENAAGPASFTMLTTAPGPDIAPFHDRQVVVLAPRDWGSWLYLERPETELLRPLPPRTLSASLQRAGKEEPDPELLKLAAE